MISFNQTFEESRAIRVLVVPIGENSLYSKHFEIVSRTRFLPVFDLNRPSDWKTQNSLLKNFNWNSSNSNIQFEYLRYDRVASGPIDLDSFQCSRRILVVIGVINYPELDSSSPSRLEQDMDYYSRRHPHIVLRRYFVFNYFAAVAQLPPGSTQPPLPPLPLYDSATKDPYAMVIFPPDGECEGGSMIDVHTKEIMGNVAVRILQAIEDWLLGCEEIRTKLASTSTYSSAPLSLPSWLPLTFSNDDAEESGNLTAGETLRRMKRRTPGRLQKWMGDLCMQVCSPLDAWDHYNIAISETRNQNDTLWLASSLEGSVCAILGMYRLGGPIIEEIPSIVKDIKTLLSNGISPNILNALLRVCEERCTEAMNLYSKNIVNCGLEVECALRLAKMHEYLTNVPEKQQKVMEFVLRAAAVPGLNVAQQIECTLEGALACLRVGLKRKYAFLVYVAALLSTDSENSFVPHSLVKCACKQYGITLDDQVYDGSLIVENPDKSWASMRRILLAHGAHFAKEYKDSSSVARYLAALLRLMGEMEENRNKNKKYWIGETLLDELSPKDDQTFGFQTNYTPWDHDSSKTVKLIETLNGFVLFPQKLLTGTDKFDDSGHTGISGFAGADNLITIPRTLSNVSSSQTISQLVESTSGLSTIVKGSNTTTTGRTLSTLGPSNALAANLGIIRPTLNSSAGDLANLDDKDDTQSETSESGNWSNRFNTEALKNSRGNITVPKIAPFVQNLVLKKKRNSKFINQTSLYQNTTTNNNINNINNNNLNNNNNNNNNNVTSTSNNNNNTNFSNNGTTNISDNGYSRSSSVIDNSNINGISQSIDNSQLQSRPSIVNSTTPVINSNQNSNQNNTPRLSTLAQVSNIPIIDPSQRLGVPIDSQSQSLQTLMTICAEIPTATSLLLDGLPYILSLTPLAASEEDAPIPIKVARNLRENNDDNESNNRSKALFYDPFEARRAKDRVKSSVMTMYWSIGKISQIEAVFCNPLAIPLTIHDVHVLIDRVSHSSYCAKSVTIPPDAQEFKTTFLVCPRESGTIKILGVRYSIFNAIYTTLVDETTGKGQAAIPRELSLPKRYPRSNVAESSKIPSAYTTNLLSSNNNNNNGNSNSNNNNGNTETKNENLQKDKIQKSPIAEIMVVLESATLSLSTSWGPDLGQTRIENIINIDSLSLTSRQSHMTSPESLSLTMYQKEHRKERIRLENLSPNLSIEDFQIIVHCSLSNTSDLKEKKISYTLLPYSKLRLASTTFSPPVLSRTFFQDELLNSSNFISDNSIVSEPPPLPFLINLIPVTSSNENNLDINNINYQQKILPQQHIYFDLEFVNFSEYIKSNIVYDMRIEIEYLSYFPNVEKYLSTNEETKNDPTTIEDSDTVYVRRSFITTTVTLSSEIGISELTPLSDNQISINNPTDDSISHLSHSFLPKLDFSIIQSTLINYNKLLPELKGNSSLKNLGFELPNQNELFSFTNSRQFSLQIDNKSQYYISISHLPFDTTSLDTPWNYFYPHNLQYVNENTEYKLTHLSPFSSANIILSITDEMLHSWYQKNSNKSIKEIIQSLLNKMKLYWIIHSPNHPITKSIQESSLSKEFYRIGYLTLSHFISNNKNIYKYFLLSFFKLQFNIPSINSNPLSLSTSPSSSSSSSPNLLSLLSPVTSNSNNLIQFLNQWNLNTRKSYKLLFNFTYFNKLIHLYYMNLFMNYKIFKINIETIFCIQVENHSCNVSQNHSNCNNWIISGNIHKLHSININNLNEDNSNNNESDNLSHEISVCFTRCGKYLIHPLIRLYIEYGDLNQVNQDNHNYTISSPWWISQPDIIYTS